MAMRIPALAEPQLRDREYRDASQSTSSERTLSGNSIQSHDLRNAQGSIQSAIIAQMVLESGLLSSTHGISKCEHDPECLASHHNDLLSN